VAYLDLQDLRKQFGAYTALDGISVSLEEGEFLSLLGPSGCGKTTALRIIAGFLQPDSGRVVINGEDMTARAPNRRDIGMVFQAYSLFPNMTAAQNVAFGLKVRKWSRPEIAERRTLLAEQIKQARFSGSLVPVPLQILAFARGEIRRVHHFPHRAPFSQAPRQQVIWRQRHIKAKVRDLRQLPDRSGHDEVFLRHQILNGVMHTFVQLLRIHNPT
jgi:ABC-type sugar transport system ATPase subunit